MLKDITFGQYFENNSFLHKLDPRTKLLLLILVIVFIFVSQNWIALSLLIFVVVFSMFLSKIPVKMYLKNLKAILPIVIFTMLINLFYSGTGEQQWCLNLFWGLKITNVSLDRALYMVVRILLLIIASAELTYTTTPNSLTDAIEKLLSPLRFIGLKGVVHTLAMMMTIALRFIPTLIEETLKIINAQKARGADIENGKLMQRIKALIPILIPLLISSVRRAYELAEAMECRCYNGGEGRVRMKQLKYGAKDYVAFFVTLLICGSVIAINIVF